MGKLFLIATPIGNLGDVTERAREVLRTVDLVLAEDTRHSRKLLSHLGIAKPLQRLDAHASEDDLARTALRIEQGDRIALLTDAGTPSVSDPGAALVRRCRERGIGVEALPGPSAVTTAIAVSGLVDGPFLFLGFLPRSGKKRRRWLARIAETEEAVVLFEAPQRMNSTLSELGEHQSERLLCVARELTKKYEEVATRSVGAWCEEAREWRGELTLVLAPFEREATRLLGEEDVDQVLRDEIARGLSARAIVAKHHANLEIPKRALYQRLLDLKKQSDFNG